VCYKYFLQQSATTLKPLTGKVNNTAHLRTMQCSAGKTCILPFTCHLWEASPNHKERPQPTAYIPVPDTIGHSQIFFLHNWMELFWQAIIKLWFVMIVELLLLSSVFWSENQYLLVWSVYLINICHLYKPKHVNNCWKSSASPTSDVHFACVVWQIQSHVEGNVHVKISANIKLSTNSSLHADCWPFNG